jgi:hypothetical protein
MADRPRNQPVSVPPQQLQPSNRKETSSSGTVLSRSFRVLQGCEEEDNKMADRWQKDADGIFVFVSPRVGVHNLEHCRPVLRFHCSATFSVSPEPDRGLIGLIPRSQDTSSFYLGNV